MHNLQQQAKANHHNGTLLLKRWFVHKYKLPTTHQLFTSQSEADLMQEFYEDLWVRRDEVRQQIDELADSGTPNPKFRTALYEQLNGINRTIGEPEEAADAEFEELEKDFAEGRVPDLTGMTHG